MKKTKLIMPIIGISATCASFAPLATLTSCNSNKFSVEMTKGSKEKTLYADTITTSFFFKQSILDNYIKTKASLTNLKVGGAEASIVSDLVKTVVDSGGNIRVDIDVQTIINHYSNPSNVEFDLNFNNKDNNKSYTIQGFKLNINEVEAPSICASKNGVITGFKEDLINMDESTFIELASTETNKDVLVQIKVANSVDPYYKFVIPSTFTGIDAAAFYKNNNTIIPSIIKSLEFAQGSKITSIGERAFQGAPFIFVTLPSSIEQIGQACFAECQNLTSFKLPETLENTAGLKIPAECFVGCSSLAYFKIPTYITQIGDAEAPAPVFTFDSGKLYLDFSEWSDVQIKNNLIFGKDFFPGGAEISGVFTHGGKVLAEINTKLNDLGLLPITVECAYDFTLVDNKAQLNLKQYPDDALAAMHDIWLISKKPTRYPLYRYELPNFYTADDSYTPIKVTKIDDICQMFLKLNKSAFQAWSSFVLPCYLESLNLGLTPFGDDSAETIYLWQLYIPSTIEPFTQNIIDWCDNFGSIRYGGTGEQWDALIDASVSRWMTNQQIDLTITCANGDTRIIKAPN